MFEGTVEPDYGQFYLKTESADHTSDSVTEPGYEAHLEATAPGFIFVATLKKFYSTPIRVEILDQEPGPPSAEWQHVAEVSFTGDGKLHVLSWPADVAFTVPTPTGSLRLRASWASLEPDLFEGLREDGSSAEHLMFQIWPAPPAERQVLRWWAEWLLPSPSSTAPDGRRQIEGQDEVMAFLTSGKLRLLPVGFEARDAEPLPGGGTGYSGLIWGDPRDGTWWVDGTDVRRVLRMVSTDEVRALASHAKPTPLHWYALPPDPRWDAMLASIGFEPESS